MAKRIKTRFKMALAMIGVMFLMSKTQVQLPAGGSCSMLGLVAIIMSLLIVLVLAIMVRMMLVHFTAKSYAGRHAR